MAESRVHRWFQFGVLDLLILTAAIAVVALLGQPLRSRTSPDLVVNLSARLQARFADETRSYQQRLRDATQEARRVALGRPWSEVEAALRREALPIVAREGQYTTDYQVLISKEGWVAADHMGHSLFLEFTVDERSTQQVAGATPGLVMIAAAGLVGEPNRAYTEVLASGTYPEGSVLYRGLRLPEAAEVAKTYPILKKVEVTYDLYRHHRWEFWPYGFALSLTFGDSARDERRGKGIYLYTSSGLDPEEDWEGKPVAQNFVAEDTIGDFWVGGSNAWEQTD